MKDVNNLSALIETWTNSDKAQAIKELRKSMSESIERTDTDIVIKYIKDSIKEGLISAKLIDYPEIGFESTARTMFYKKAIQSTLEATEVDGRDGSDKNQTPKVILNGTNEDVGVATDLTLIAMIGEGAFTWDRP